MGQALTGGRGTRRDAVRLAPRSGQAGLTLVELIVAFSLLLILSLMALPVAQVKVRREKERRLRHALHEIRQAIDRHKDMADAGELDELDPDRHGYPASLEELVEGVGTERPPGAQADAGFGLGIDPSSPGLADQDGFGSRSRDSTRDRSAGSARRRPGQPFGDRNQGLGLDEEEESGTLRFLRSIPVDPMTGRSEWGLLSTSDDPQARAWSGLNVFDVYSLSPGIALDGTRYSDW